MKKQLFLSFVAGLFPCIFTCVLIGAISVSTAFAEDFDATLKRVSELRTQGKYAEALNELSFAQQELQKQHVTKMREFFPATLGEFKGGEFETNDALGFFMLERPYSNGKGSKVKLSLSGSGTSQGAAATGIGALAGLAQMAAAFDNSGQTESVRVKSLRGTITTQGGKMRLMLSLSSGKLLQLEQDSSSPVSKEQLVAMAEGIDYTQLNSYISAQ